MHVQYILVALHHSWSKQPVDSQNKTLCNSRRKGKYDGLKGIYEIRNANLPFFGSDFLAGATENKSSSSSSNNPPPEGALD